MKYFAQSAFRYIQRQVNKAGSNGSASKVMLMMPSLPPEVILDVGSRVTSFCADKPSLAIPLIKVAQPLANEWQSLRDLHAAQAADAVRDSGWYDDAGTLTSYRHRPASGETRPIVLLFGVDRVTDASSLEDFHHCDLQTIWEDELQRCFDAWIAAKLDDCSIGYEDDTFIHFNWVLLPVVERGLADVLQISTLLQQLELSEAQDGRDAEKVLLNSLDRFGLPPFGSLRFTTPKAFGAYLDQSLSFFSYESFMEDRSRKKALNTVDTFVKHNELGELFAPNERPKFDSDSSFVTGVRKYIESADSALADRLFECDFTTIYDKILGFRYSEPKERKESVRKLSGGPIETVLTALWSTLGEFKRVADKKDVFAHEVLSKIVIKSHVFKHDSDGESAEERKQKASRDLARLLGGVDRFLKNWIDGSKLCAEERHDLITSSLLHPDVTFQPCGTAEPNLQFSVSVHGEGIEKPVVKQFAWRLPEVHSYRVADELIRWAAAAVDASSGYCLPVFHVPFYEELMLAKDDEETRRVLLQSIRDEGDELENLLNASELDTQDPLLPGIRNLASAYDHFLQSAKTDGLHTALLDRWDDLRKACEQAGGPHY
jgi:hypothetical protein